MGICDKYLAVIVSLVVIVFAGTAMGAGIPESAIKVSF